MNDKFLETLRSKNAERQAEWDSGSNFDLSYHALELMTEAGELCEQVKKLYREMLGAKGNKTDLQAIKDEIGDVMICLDKLVSEIEKSTNTTISIEDCTKDKFNKTSEKYNFKTEF